MQLSLLGGGRPRVDRDFRGVRRIWLDSESWLDHRPSWLSGHAQVFDALVGGLNWKTKRRLMWDNLVDVPRMMASVPGDGPEPTVFGAIREALGTRYQARFDRVHLNYYRDGRDSVASHRDRMISDRSDVVVAIVSFGEPRRFVVRPHGGGKLAARLNLGWGDLLVMGGAVQRDWEHGVPKCAHAGPRISAMFRRVQDRLTDPKSAGEQARRG